MAKKSKSVSKAASVLASDDSSADAKSLAGSVLATSDNDLHPEKPYSVLGASGHNSPTEPEAPLIKEPEVATDFPVYEPEEEPLVRFQDEPYIEAEPLEIVGEYSPDLADSETLDEFPAVDVPEVEEAIAPILPKDIGEQVAAAQEAAGHVPVQPNASRD